MVLPPPHVFFKENKRMRESSIQLGGIASLPSGILYRKNNKCMKKRKRE